MKTFILITLSILLFTPYFHVLNSQTEPSTQDGFITKIFGGEQIDISETPYQVSLKIHGQHICGGVIISNTWILTAAHCLTHPVLVPNQNNTFVHVGTNDRLDYNTGQMVQVNAYHIHPYFDESTYENDIALLQLSTPLTFNEKVMPIEYANSCNTSESDYYEGRNVIISGWGNSNDTPLGSSQFLNAVTIPIISREDAMTINQTSTSSACHLNVSNNMLAFYSPGIASGKGDSGGPAVMSNNGNDINIGITSWGCPPSADMPSIYVNVRNYSSWIEHVTGIAISKPGVDLYMRDRPWDLGNEPSNVDFSWVSDDIWVRNQNDGQSNDTHQNPIFHNTNANYINIRIRNRGCLPSSGNDVLKVYWAKASTALAWPNHWNGSLNVNGQSLGNSIGDAIIPVVQPGGSVVVTIPWFPPNPLNYAGLSTDPLIWNEEPHHFCILSRIESANDPMTVVEGNHLGDNVVKNNNISLKNVSVFNLYPSPDKETKFSSTIFIGNPQEMAHPFRFEIKGCHLAEHYKLDSIAEFIITMDSLIWQRWLDGGMQSSGNVRIFNARNHQLLVKLNAQIGNIVLQPQEYRPLKLSVHFLIRNEISDVQGKINIVQINETDNKILGGEQFDIQRYTRSPFVANAGGDKEIIYSDSLLLIAQDIFEDAIFNWYDEEGLLIHIGREFKMMVLENQKFKLEVVSLSDGSKDYDSIEVSVKPPLIECVTPNPASDNVSFGLNLPSSSFFSLVFTNILTNQMQFVPVYFNESQVYNVSLDNFESGYYAVSLVSGSTLYDSKYLFIQKQ